MSEENIEGIPTETHAEIWNTLAKFLKQFLKKPLEGFLPDVN